MITQLTSVTVYVTDQDRALAFYRDALGMEVRDDVASGPYRWLSVAPAGAQTSLQLEKAGAETRQPGTATGYILASNDMQADYERMLAAGVAFTYPPKENPYSWETEFSDPDGNSFRFVQLKRG